MVNNAATIHTFVATVKRLVGCAETTDVEWIDFYSVSLVEKHRYRVR